MAAEIKLLTRESCGLCGDFIAAFQKAFPEIALEQADVDSRQDWQRKYGNHVPVLLVDDSMVCQHFFDEARIRANLTGL